MAELLFLHSHIIPLLNGAYGGGVGAGAAYSEFLQSLYQGSLRISGGGLGEFLLAQRPLGDELFPFFDLGHGRVRRGVCGVVNLHEAREGEQTARGMEGIFAVLYVRTRGVVDGRGHLGGDEALVYEVVKVILIPCQLLFEFLRGQREVCGAYGFVGVLYLALLAVGVAGVISLAVFFLYQSLCGGLGFVGHPDGVRADIGDKPHMTHAFHLQPLIEHLGYGHGLFGGVIKLVGAVLLEGTGGEGGVGLAGLFRLGDF